MMSLHQKYIIDEHGNKTAVMLPYDEWEKILELLEEIDDIKAYDKAKAEKSDPVTFKDALKSL